jgi:hypothetical protein
MDGQSTDELGVSTGRVRLLGWRSNWSIWHYIPRLSLKLDRSRGLSSLRVTYVSQGPTLEGRAARNGRKELHKCLLSQSLNSLSLPLSLSLQSKLQRDILLCDCLKNTACTSLHHNAWPSEKKGLKYA